jgi:catechol 2,3-dioxygenase
MQIGHVHLKIRDLNRSISFYQDYLGLKVTEKLGDGMAFLSGTDRHHEIALQQLGPQAGSPGRFDVGLYHVAFEVPDRESFLALYDKLQNDGITVYPTDHRISWALYFSDPDGNGIEVYLDTRNNPDGTKFWEGRDRILDRDRLN